MADLTQAQRDAIVARYALTVYEARREAEAQLRGLVPPPAPDLDAEALMDRIATMAGRGAAVDATPTIASIERYLGLDSAGGRDPK